MLLTKIFVLIFAVFALALAIIIRRRGNIQDSFRGKVAACPACKLNLVTVGIWKRRGPRGDAFTCAGCETVSHWDMDASPPLLRD